jgi:hypothetical protein
MTTHRSWWSKTNPAAQRFDSILSSQMSLRTSVEINEERYVLNARRGGLERIVSRDSLSTARESAFVSAEQPPRQSIAPA